MNKHFFLRPLAIVLALLIVLTMLSGCGTKNEVKSNEFNFGFWGIVSLNPVRSQTRTDFNVMYLLQMQLVRFYGSQIEMDAATEFEKNEEGTKYVFKLRDGLKWENGDPLTAKDFEYGAFWRLWDCTHQVRDTGGWGGCQGLALQGE